MLDVGLRYVVCGAVSVWGDIFALATVTCSVVRDLFWWALLSSLYECCLCLGPREVSVSSRDGSSSLAVVSLFRFVLWFVLLPSFGFPNPWCFVLETRDFSF